MGKLKTDSNFTLKGNARTNLRKLGFGKDIFCVHFRAEGFFFIAVDIFMLFFVGSGWMFYFVIFIQTTINTGINIGAILFAGECLQV